MSLNDAAFLTYALILGASLLMVVVVLLSKLS